MEVTKALSEYIKAKGITITSISEHTGISYGVLQPSLSGARKLRADEFLNVCCYLNENPLTFYDNKLKAGQVAATKQSEPANISERR